MNIYNVSVNYSLCTIEKMSYVIYDPIRYHLVMCKIDIKNECCYETKNAV